MLDEDLDIFTSREFGQQFLIEGKKVFGIFDESYYNLFPGSSIDSEGRNITLLVQTNMLVDVSLGASVSGDNRQFSIVSIQPIDDGLFTNLILKEL